MQSEKIGERIKGIKLLVNQGEKSYPLIMQALGDSSWQVRKEAVKVAVDWLPLNYLLEEFSSENSHLRSAAMEAILKKGRKSKSLLIKAFKEGNERKKIISILALGEMKDPTVIPFLIEVLGGKESLNVKFEVIEALAKIGDEKAAPALVNLLYEDEWLAIPALLALCRLNEDFLVPTFLELLSSGLEPELLIEALGKAGDLSSISVLSELFVKKPELEEAIVKATAQIAWRFYQRAYFGREKEAIFKAVQKNFGQFEKKILPYLNSAIKREALVLLALMGSDKGFLKALLSFSQGEEETISIFVLSLGKKASSLIMQNFSHLSLGAQELSLRLLLSLSPRTALKLAFQLLNGEDEEIKKAAVEVIGEVGSDREKIKLLDYLNEFLENSIAQAIAGVLNKEILLKALEDSSSIAKITALKALVFSQSVPSSLLPKVIDLIKDPDVFIRRWAARALFYHPCQDCAKSLQRALYDEDEKVKELAVTALLEMPFTKVSQFDFLLTSSTGVKYRLAQHLWKKGKKAIVLLNKLLEDKERIVSLAAISSLARLEKKEAGSLIRKMVHSHQAENRQKVAELAQVFSFEERKALLSQLLKDKAKVVRLAALTAVSQLKDSRFLELIEVSDLNSPEEKEIVLDFLKETKWQTKDVGKALEMIEKLVLEQSLVEKSREVLSNLFFQFPELIIKNISNRLKPFLIQIIGRHRKKEYLPLLKSWFREGESPVKRLALIAIEEIAPQDSQTIINQISEEERNLLEL